MWRWGEGVPGGVAGGLWTVKYGIRRWRRVREGGGAGRGEGGRGGRERRVGSRVGGGEEVDAWTSARGVAGVVAEGGGGMAVRRAR